MPRSEREKSIDRIFALVRDLGVDPDEVPERHRDALLKEVRQQRLNEHETALSVAFGLLPNLLEEDFEEARVLVDRLAVTADSWDDEDLIDRRRLTALERDARAALRRARR